MPPTTIDPFELWPRCRSAIAGLRAGEAHRKANYAFHTGYHYVDGRQATYHVRIDGLGARAGRLRIRVQALGDRGPATLVEERRFDLAKDVSGAAEVVLRFPATFGVGYALRGIVDRGRDVVARSVAVTLDRVADAGTFERALADARTTVFGRPSAARRGRWPFRKAIEAPGLEQRGPATIAMPASQMCTAAQFDEPDYRRWADAMRWPATRQRKQWEFVYILAVLERHGMLAAGRRGLGFGTGTEPLPALMASLGCEVVATDLPIGEQAAIWAAGDRHARSVEALWRPDLVDRAVFDRNVSFRPADMNAIPRDLEGFDFCWSACAYEHLGSIAAGLRFVERSLATLRPGGIAVHTTELNLTSDEATVDRQATVLFRRRDFESLAARLNAGGHRVLPLCWDQGADPIDRHVDLPPNSRDAHLKLALAHYVTTSFGIAVVRDGRALGMPAVVLGDEVT